MREKERERERGQCYKVNQYAASGVRGHARTGQTEIPQKTATLVVRYACLALQQMVRNTPRKTENTPNTSCVCCFCQCCETADCAPRSSLRLHEAITSCKSVYAATTLPTQLRLCHCRRYHSQLSEPKIHIWCKSSYNDGTNSSEVTSFKCKSNYAYFSYSTFKWFLSGTI